MPIDDLMRRLDPGVDGVVGRLYPPMHAASNVVDLPRMRAPRGVPTASDAGAESV
jgi:hypothetical protein